MKPSIALVMFVHNDLRWLRATLPYDMRWADQVCILDMGSTDGTREYCRAFLRDNDRYQRREENTCPELGFDEAKSAAAALALTDWIYHSAADQVLSLGQGELIHKACAEADGKDALTVDCLNLNMPNGNLPEQWESNYHLSAPDVHREHHHRLLRNHKGIQYRGYIHEEPFYPSGEHCATNSKWTPLEMFHFQGCQNAEMRRMRYSWMFRRAMQNPELQKWTNKWWYEVHCARSKDEINEWADKYEKHVAATGEK